jgi:tetratricopeptide (TPR) repeat protein
MTARPGWIAVGLLCLFGQVVRAAGEPNVAPALEAWEKGQAAMKQGRFEEAVACYRLSLRLDPRLTRNYLSLAAAYLERGQDEQAAPCLAQYLQRQPDQALVRAHYAELLCRLGRRREAGEQLERFVATAQERPKLAREYLVNVHSRLMEIAQAEDDDYGEHLHRGIGLFLLAQQGDPESESGGDASREGLLCRAAGELALAQMDRPKEARPCWYLYQVWSRLAQRRPAGRWLRAAEAAGPFTYLTPSERRGLQFAARASCLEGRRK